jgi:hypothetical protein
LTDEEPPSTVENVMRATLPTRDFVLVLDPYCLGGLLTAPLSGVLTLISDLADLAPPISIRLVLPHYLATDDATSVGDSRVFRGFLGSPAPS